MARSGLGRLWMFLRKPLFQGDSSRLSEAIDQEIEQPGRSGDPVLAALTRTANPHPLPPDLKERSWMALEKEIFASPAAHPPLSVPYRDRESPSLLTTLLYRVPRVMVAGAALFVCGLGYGAWHGSYLAARPIVDRAALSWSQVRSYDGDVQFVSFIPRLQMQWAGRQLYQAPDQMQLQVTLMGLHSTMTVNKDLGMIETATTGMNEESLARYRFLARTLRLDEAVGALQSSNHVRYEGSDRLLGQECYVLSFSLPGREDPGGGAPLLADTVPGARSGKVWISRSLLLPLQVELYGQSDEIEVAYRFSRFAANVDLDPKTFMIPTVPIHPLARSHTPAGARHPADGQILHRSTMQVQWMAFHIPEGPGR